jgi:L-seryl-tRNA(Ser) seleniumtransferase
MMPPNPLRNLPSIHEVLDSPSLRAVLDRISRSTVVSTVRTVLDEVRREMQTAAADRTLPSARDLAERIALRVAQGPSPELRPVINATGVLLGGELGSPPLAEEAITAVAAVAGDYAGLALDPATARPCRPSAAVEQLLGELCGAEAALVANSDAAATLLALAALAAGREVVVARGQVVHRGGGWRLPDLLSAGGALPREVGTTSGASLDDYAQAVGESTAAILVVNSGPVTAGGAASAPTLEELAALGRRHQLPVIHDLAGGALADFRHFGLPGQPLVSESIKQGAGLVLLSGDKLLGGPACGIILGRTALVERIERHPLAAVLSADRLSLAALAATVRLYRDPQKASLSIPLLRLLGTAVENLRNRAERLAPQAAATPAIAEAEATADAASFGWGAGPALELPTWCVALRPAKMTVDRLADALRSGTPAVLGRKKEDRLLLDLRSVLPRQDTQLRAALEALGKSEALTEAADPL